jgi:hypothetical protein
LTAPKERDGTALAGYGCLVTSSLLGGVVSALGFFLGLSSYFAAQQASLSEVRETSTYLSTLESAVAWSGLGAVGALVGFGSLILLVKELSEDSARKQRGAV